MFPSINARNMHLEIVAGAAVLILSALALGAVITLQPAYLIALIAVGSCFLLIAKWGSWTRSASNVGGAPVVVLVSGVVIYLLGSIQLAPNAIYSNSIERQQWILYIAALVLAIVAVILGSAARRKDSRIVEPTLFTKATYQRFPLLLAAATGLVVTWTNFSTGTIPLFESSVNQARKVGVGGVLSTLNFFGFATLQFVMIALMMVPFAGISKPLKYSILIISGTTLVFTGSRSFLIFVAIALFVAYLESARPAFIKMIGIALTLGAIFIIAGSVRSAVSGQSYEVEQNSERLGYGSGYQAEVYTNLQPGPRVFAHTQTVIPDSIPYQHGAFILRDMPFIGMGQTSDRWVTDHVMGRDPSSIGGLPPTILGGFYIDWGYAGVAVGVGFLFFSLAYFRPRARALGQCLTTNMSYAIFAAYLFTSFYSYISLKGSIVVLFMWTVLLGVFRSRQAIRNNVDVVQTR
ncbi:O-antigen polymerase [Rhodococcus jostii]|uniref:O-antigen polymerase n=1 Tax=Rhodococcus jostii TaxID=132919 RepID=UPI00363BEA04